MWTSRRDWSGIWGKQRSEVGKNCQKKYNGDGGSFEYIDCGLKQKT